MKHIVESVEEMYHARQPTGEVIVDEVLNILRHYKLIYPEDVALLMDVKVRDLRSAWYMLTGTRLVDVITQTGFASASVRLAPSAARKESWSSCSKRQPVAADGGRK